MYMYMYIVEQNSSSAALPHTVHYMMYTNIVHTQCVGSEVVGHVTADVIYHTSIHVHNVCRYIIIIQVYTDVWCQYTVSTGLTF